jgi:hypothetical protein
MKPLQKTKSEGSPSSRHFLMIWPIIVNFKNPMRMAHTYEKQFPRPMPTTGPTVATNPGPLKLLSLT